MDTQISDFNAAALETARGIILGNDLVAFATETVYGLGGNALSETAVHKIFEVKGRPQDNPLIVHLDSAKKLSAVAKNIGADAEKLAKAFMPGALTMVLEKRDCIAPAVSCGLTTVAVRVPEHAGARAFLASCGVPVAAPSANTSTRPSPTAAEHVYEDLHGKIPLILNGGSCRVGIESTVIDMTQKSPLILRPGIITPEEIGEVLGKSVAVAIGGASGRASSPGMKYKHYAPRCDMLLVRKAGMLLSLYREKRAEGLDPVVFCFEENVAALSGCRVSSLGKNAYEAANRFYGMLREYENQCGIILCECPKCERAGYALYNRMIKSAGQKIV